MGIQCVAAKAKKCVAAQCRFSHLHTQLGKEKEKPRAVWYMYLKIENCYLKKFVKICVGEKVH